MSHPLVRRGLVARAALLGTAATTAAAFAVVLPAGTAEAHHDATGRASAQAVQGTGILQILDTSPRCEAIDTDQTRTATPTGRCGAGLAFEGEQVATFDQSASAGNGSSSATAGTAPIAIKDFTSLDLNGVLDGVGAINTGTVLDPIVNALDPVTQGLVKTALAPLIKPLNDALQSTLHGVHQALPLSVEVGAVTAQCAATGSPLTATGSTTVAKIDIIVKLGTTQVRAPITLNTAPNSPLTVTAPQDLVNGVLAGLRATFTQTLGGLLAPLNVLVSGIQDTITDALFAALEPSLLTGLTGALRGVVSGTTNIQTPVSPSASGAISVTALELNLLTNNTARLANATCGPNTPGTVDHTAITSPTEGEATNDSTPPISGTGEPGSNVTITIDGGTPVTVPVDGNGHWTYTPTAPLDEGNHTVVVDGDSNGAGKDDEVTFSVDTVAPAAPAITAPANGSHTKDTTPTIAGTGEAGATVEVKIDGTVIGTTTVDDKGNWSLTPTTPLAEGPHTVTANQTDEAGNVSDAASVDFTVDTTAPAPTVIDSPAAGEATNDTKPTVSGTGEPGSNVTITIDGGAPVTVPVDGDGNWTYTPATDLGEGEHTVTVDGDANGSGVDDTVTFDVDTIAPAAPVITTPTDGSTTNDATPLITGTGEAGATVEVKVDGTVIGTTTVDGTGNWSLTPTKPLAQGPHTVTAIQTDEAGNSSDSANATFTVDTTSTGGTPIDTDGDGLSDTDEAAIGTDPNKADTDGDGLSDGQEVNGPTGCTTGHTNPLKPDTDGDGLTDGQEVHGVDVKQAYYTNRGVPRKAKTIGIVKTNPCVADTDGDGLTDGQEVHGIKINQKISRSKANGGTYKIKVRMTDPTRRDTDGDGISDYDEVTGAKNKRFKHRKTDPTLADTDWGGGKDGKEIKTKHDPSRHG